MPRACGRSGEQDGQRQREEDHPSGEKRVTDARDDDPRRSAIPRDPPRRETRVRERAAAAAAAAVVVDAYNADY